MTIAKGDKLPAGTLRRKTDAGVEEVKAEELFGKGTVILFGVPGAFTGTCTKEHMPSYIRNREKLREQGVSKIYCIAVNDPFVARAWQDATGASETDIEVLADWNAEYVKKLGLTADLSAAGLGIRAARFALVVKDGVVEEVQQEENNGKVTNTGAESLMSCSISHAA